MREGFSVREGGCKFSIENILGSLASSEPHHRNKKKDPANYTDISEDEVDIDEEDSDEDSSHLR